VRNNEVDPDRLLLCPLCPQVCAKADRQQAAQSLPFDRPIHRLPHDRCSCIQPAQNGTAANCISRNSSFAP